MKSINWKMYEKGFNLSNATGHNCKRNCLLRGKRERRKKKKILENDQYIVSSVIIIITINHGCKRESQRERERERER